jgi:hypothetical protein
MKELPILYSAPMVKAYLAGRKTQTRRLAFGANGKPTRWVKLWHDLHNINPYRPLNDRVQYQLWGRETFGKLYHGDNADEEHHDIRYRADGEVGIKWTPSIHMPRWAARIIQPVAEVRFQRLQDITEEDAIAEGIERLKSGREYYHLITPKGVLRLNHYALSAKEAYALLWDSLHGKNPQHCWDANPEVVAISYPKYEA